MARHDDAALPSWMLVNVMPAAIALLPAFAFQAGYDLSGIRLKYWHRPALFMRKYIRISLSVQLLSDFSAVEFACTP